MRRVAKYQIVEFKTGERVWNTTVYNNLKDLIKGMKKLLINENLNLISSSFGILIKKVLSN